MSYIERIFMYLRASVVSFGEFTNFLIDTKINFLIGEITLLELCTLGSLLAFLSIAVIKWVVH